MLIGVIADTHDLVRPEVRELFTISTPLTWTR